MKAKNARPSHSNVMTSPKSGTSRPGLARTSATRTGSAGSYTTRSWSPAEGAGERPVAAADLTEIGALAAEALARAVARGVYEAAALPCPGAVPSWRDRFGGG